MREILKQAGGRALGEITLRGFRKEVAGIENLKTTKHHLQQGGSVLIYADHYSTFDFAIYFEIIRRFTSLDKAGTIISMKHIDSTRGLGSKFKSAMTNLWVDSFGATAIPMVQSYDMQHYANARKIIKDGINASVDFLNQPGNVLFVTPEGTRIRDRKLGQGERGLELILRKTKDQNVLILPLAAIHDRIIPIATDTLVSAGKPFTYPEILTEQQANPDITVIDLMMLRIADLLPESNQGYYEDLLKNHPQLRRHPELAHIEKYY